jgi:polynucleotide 5'-triphosphatase
MALYISIHPPSSWLNADVLRQPELLHELEVEITRPEYLLATAERRENPAASEDERIAFDELIRALVNNMRIMVRNIPPNDAWR